MVDECRSSVGKWIQNLNNGREDPMTNRISWIGSLLLVLLAALLGLASHAQAGLKFYTGALTFEGYGNTRVDGHKLDSMTTAASTWTAYSLLIQPVGQFCNYHNPTQMSPVCASPPLTENGSANYSRCFISTGYTPPKESLIVGPCATTPGFIPSAPITGSNSATTEMTTFTTVKGEIACAPGTGDPRNACSFPHPPAIIMPGAPHTSTANGAFGTFIGGVGGVGSGSVDANYPGGGNIIYSVTYLTLGTGMGTFFPGGGPAPIHTVTGAPTNPILGTANGNDIFSYRAGPGQASGYIAVDPGPNRFGGTMKLLGRSRSNQFWYSPAYGGYLNTSLKALFQFHGGGDNALAPWLAETTMGMGTTTGNGALLHPRPSAGYRGQRCPFTSTYKTLGPPHNPCPSRTTNFAGRTDGNMSPQYTTVNGTVPITNFSRFIKTATEWTTGVAVVTAPGFGFTTVIQRTGYDNRNVNGFGTIQLVAPHLTNWFFGSLGQTVSSLGGISVMKLQFVPEPTGWMALGSGVLVLGLLDRVRARRTRR
jgi:hypothetical protein